MLARVLSGAVLGIDAYLVNVEADVASGLPQFTIVGLPQGAVKEGRERVVAAVQNSTFAVPPKRITINLAPADLTSPRVHRIESYGSRWRGWWSRRLAYYVGVPRICLVASPLLTAH